MWLALVVLGAGWIGIGILLGFIEIQVHLQRYLPSKDLYSADHLAIFDDVNLVDWPFDVAFFQGWALQRHDPVIFLSDGGVALVDNPLDLLASMVDLL